MKNRAFTLLECLIYLAIFSVFVTNTVVVLGDLRHELAQQQIDFARLGDRHFLFQKIEYLLNTADTVIVVDTHTLQIIRDSVTTELVLQNNQFFLRYIDRLSESISPSYLVVDDVAFSVTTNTPYTHVLVEYRVDGKLVRHSWYGE
jgi:type II secretory pathway pseudopilin PulG